MVQEIKIEDFNYDLPEERIARHPLEKRDECKLLLHTASGAIYHRKFKELPDLLPPGTMMVCNDTKVINARLLFHKDTGAAIEIFLLEPISPADYALNFQSKDKCTWKCLVGNLKKWKEGLITASVSCRDKACHVSREVGVQPDKCRDMACHVRKENSEITLKARRVRDLSEGGCEIEFSWDDPELTFGQLLEIVGRIPIPPYLNRDSEESDLKDYQTVYAEVKGSVAAPTAGLHFTPVLFENLAAHAVAVEKLTLHVGAGTFKPVKSETIGDHDMHSEPFTVTRHLIEKLIEWKESGKPVLAVGTTTVRTLESLPYIGNAIKEREINPFHLDQWRAYGNKADFDTLDALKSILSWMDENNPNSFTATTAIMIAPGFRWRIVDLIVTNFHQPQSTLLLLVSSFLEHNDISCHIIHETAEQTDKCRDMACHVSRETTELPDKCRDIACDVSHETAELTGECRDMACHVSHETVELTGECRDIACDVSHETAELTGECRDMACHVNNDKPEWKKMYDEALRAGYRFLSYGDACLLVSHP